MKDYSKLTKSIKEFIRLKYPGVKCTVKQIKYNGIIHAFFLQFPTDKLLEKTWEPLFNAIAFYYQSKIESEFERWNFYIFYIVQTPVNRALKYKIENDPISSRKIVLDPYTHTLTPKKIKDIIEQHITNQNVDFSVQEPASNSGKAGFSKNPLFENAISRFPPSVKKRKGEDQTYSILETIEKHYRNENQKG